VSLVIPTPTPVRPGAGEVFSAVRPEMSKDWNTKVTKAHEMHEIKSRRQADFRAFRGFSQLS
jgi:hypothetical protein